MVPGIALAGLVILAIILAYVKAWQIKTMVDESMKNAGPK